MSDKAMYSIVCICLSFVAFSLNVLFIECVAYKFDCIPNSLQVQNTQAMCIHGETEL